MKQQTLLRPVACRGGCPTLHAQYGLPVVGTEKHIGKQAAL